MSTWAYFKGLIDKEWDDLTTPVQKLPRTITPLSGLSQRAALAVNPVPLILATGAGSLIKSFPGQHSVIAIGKISHTGMDFYRVYLSNAPDSYLHLAVAQDNPTAILESRIYQPYSELILPYQTVEQANRHRAPDDDQSYLSAEFWLKDDDDPAIGGLIGCPVMPGKVEDGSIGYPRTWVAEANNMRIPPVFVTEYILDRKGGTPVHQHQMMHYGRALNAEIDEYLLVAAVSEKGGASQSLNMWLGMEVKLDDLTIYPSAT
jgi:hypothetical protein